MGDGLGRHGKTWPNYKKTRVFGEDDCYAVERAGFLERERLWLLRGSFISISLDACFVMALVRSKAT